MSIDEERFQHAYLNRFHYADRTDDGYGPDSPRIGDRGVLVRGLDFEPFLVQVEPRTGLPALKLENSGWAGLFEVAALEYSDSEIILHARTHDTAIINENGVIDLDPPYEGNETVTWAHGRLYTADSERPIGMDDSAFDVMDALIRLGYEPIERKNGE